jgi:hypothetical protein
MSSHGRELDQVCGVCHQCRLANHPELMLMLDRPRVVALEILGGSVRSRRIDRSIIGLTRQKAPQSDQGREARQVASMRTGLSLRSEVRVLSRLRE